MLSENIRAARKARGLSQEELAARLNVVRQTISKWEQGLSVPDADLLIILSKALEIPVSALLGETVPPEKPDEIQILSEKLEAINLQLARRKIARRKLLRGALAALCLIVLAGLAGLYAAHSPYLNWDYHDPETAVAGAALHGFEWLFVRAAPLLLTGGIVGLFLTRKKK